MSSGIATAKVLPFRRRAGRDVLPGEGAPVCVVVGPHRLLLDPDRIISVHERAVARWMPAMPDWAAWVEGPFGTIAGLDLRRRMLEREPGWPHAVESVSAVTIAWDWQRIALVVDRIEGELAVDRRAFVAVVPAETHPVTARGIHRGALVGCLDVDGLLTHPLARRALAQRVPEHAG